MPGTQTKDSQDNEKVSRMRSNLFQSNDSVTDILRQEMMKSVVSNELNSLSSINSLGGGQEDSGTVVMKGLKPPAPSTRSSTASSGAFLETMLATLKSRPSTRSTSGSGPSVAFATKASSSAKPPSAKAIEDLTSSKNWNNLGSHEDVNVTDVFKTQQDSGNGAAAGASAAATATADQPSANGTEKKKNKTNWDEIMKQGLQASIIVPPPPHSAAVAAAIVNNQNINLHPTATPSNAVAPMVTAAVAGKSHALPESVVTTATKNRKDTGKKRTRVKEEADGVSANNPKSKKAAADASSQDREYFEPNDVDVLLGRGGRANNHPGNKKYLEAKDSIQERYMAAEKAEKTVISEELMEMVKQWGGKFLKMDESANQWYQVDKVTARKKCSQTLREINTPEVRAAKRQKYNK